MLVLRRVCRHYRVNSPAPVNFQHTPRFSSSLDGRLADWDTLPVLDVHVDADDVRLTEAASRARQSGTRLSRLLELLKLGGGDKSRHRHVSVNGKLLVWDRLRLLVDDERRVLDLGALSGLGMEYGDVPYAGLVTVIAQVNGRYCLICANDATVKGGTYFPIAVTKSMRAQHIGAAHRLPSISLVDSGGGFLPLQSELFPDKWHGGRGFRNQAVQSSAGVAQLAVVCGACTAGGAYTPTMSDEAVMVDGISSLFLGGPPLVRAATGELVSEQQLGGCSVHCDVSGCCDYFAESETQAFTACREIVSSLNIPRAGSDVAEEIEAPSVEAAMLDVLSGVDHLTRSDLYAVLAALLDGGRFREFKRTYGSGVVTGFGRLAGRLVGVVANYNWLTSRDSTKIAHMVKLCDQRAVPMLFLQNSSSNMLPVHEEEDGCDDGAVLKCRARAVAAIATSRVPRLSINLTGCHGDDHLTMNGVSMEPSFYLSWPLATFSPLHMYGSTPPGGDCSAPVKSAVAAEIPRDSCLYYASRSLIDSVIQPSETRQQLLLCMEIISVGTCVQQRRHSVLRM